MKIKKNQICFGDALDYYQKWTPPITIVSDGPYGISGYEGDIKSPNKLLEFYEPHINKWSEFATAQTTLWFWNTELGWANVHNQIEKNGWIFKGCNTWNKGIAHIAGNCNGKTIRKFPIVTEVCVHYVRKESFNINKEMNLQQWLRDEWNKTGLTLHHANIACGLKSAASRKYLTKDHLWYCPPEKEFKMLTDYANEHGKKENKPYFSLDGVDVITQSQWSKIRAKFNFEYGITNIWNEPALKQKSRYSNENISHPSEKPLNLIKRIIDASSDPGDVIWEPFAGSGVVSKYALDTNRMFFCAEINKKYLELLKSRLNCNKKF